MPSQLTAYRIFIASPGGLDAERRLFRDVVNRYNELHAIPRGVLFIPIGWDLALAGRGRPKELISSWLRRCDYFVLILWDRWGSPPSRKGPYTSGTEEEFHLACSLYAAFG